MQTTKLDFPHNSRAVYTAVKHLFETKRTQFTSLKMDDELFILELRLGANKNHLSDLSDYINNEVHKLCQPGEIPMIKNN